jgi:hypothetical protein
MRISFMGNLQSLQMVRFMRIPTIPVCTENLVRIDQMRESLNVGRDGRSDISVREPGCFALQLQEPT